MPIVNVKISFRIKNLKKVKKHTVIRHNKCVIFIYPNGTINVTGLKTLDNIDETVESVTKYLGHTVSEVSKIKIDNATYTNSVKKVVPLATIAKTCNSKHVDIRYNPSVFPGEKSVQHKNVIIIIDKMF